MVVRNQLAVSGLVTAWFAGAGRGKDGRWASNFSHGEPEAARPCGCRCWSTPWRSFHARNTAQFPVIGWNSLRCSRSLPDRQRHTPLMLLASACETRTQAAFADLLTRNLQPRPFFPLHSTQFRFLAREVIARHRHHALALGKLDLEIHQV